MGERKKREKKRERKRERKRQREREPKKKRMCVGGRNREKKEIERKERIDRDLEDVCGGIT